MAKSSKKNNAPVSGGPEDVQQKGESPFEYSARRATELSNDGASSTYRPGPVPNLVQQFRGEPEPRA